MSTKKLTTLSICYDEYYQKSPGNIEFSMFPGLYYFLSKGNMIYPLKGNIIYPFTLLIQIIYIRPEEEYKKTNLFSYRYYQHNDFPRSLGYEKIKEDL